MIDLSDLRPEARYGVPAADQILVNRQYIVGYSFLFRQPRWALQLIDPTTQEVDKTVRRQIRFREDVRLPEMFRSSEGDYTGSGFDRGHLISSADRKARMVVNSETFLMSNICPQSPYLNRLFVANSYLGQVTGSWSEILYEWKFSGCAGILPGSVRNRYDLLGTCVHGRLQYSY